MDQAKRLRMTPEGVPCEVALVENLHHVGIVRNHTWMLGPPDAGAQLRSRGSGTADPTCWIVRDYCDKGTLGVRGFRESLGPRWGLRRFLLEMMQQAWPPIGRVGLLSSSGKGMLQGLERQWVIRGVPFAIAFPVVNKCLVNRDCTLLLLLVTGGFVVDAVQQAVEKGLFCSNGSGSCLSSRYINLRAVALTAYEICTAMLFIHAHNILHLVSTCLTAAAI